MSRNVAGCAGPEDSGLHPPPAGRDGAGLQPRGQGPPRPVRAGHIPPPCTHIYIYIYIYMYIYMYDVCVYIDIFIYIHPTPYTLHPTPHTLHPTS